MQELTPPESYSNLSSLYYSLMISKNKKAAMYLLKSIFNGFITEFFHSAEDGGSRPWAPLSVPFQQV
jgi:hypothetical protein